MGPNVPAGRLPPWPIIVSGLAMLLIISWAVRACPVESDRRPTVSRELNITGKGRSCILCITGYRTFKSRLNHTITDADWNGAGPGRMPRSGSAFSGSQS